MKIIELRILPPIAIGRLGASAIPLAAFDLKINPEKPLDYREIVPKETFEVNKETGEIKSYIPKSITFKDPQPDDPSKMVIRPLAPFLEVYAITDESPEHAVPLTLQLLEKADLSIDQLSWNAEVSNIKLFRRTQDPNDKITAFLAGIADHAPHILRGESPNFIEGKFLPFGTIQYVRPTTQHPGIRLRFTPAGGRVYGSARQRIGKSGQLEVDPIIDNDDLVIYDNKKGKWQGYGDGADPTQDVNLFTNPGAIYAGYDNADGVHISWGYLDDECDGQISVSLNTGEDTELTAKAWVGAGPPAFAPDTLPVRVISDELEQIIYGPERGDDVTIDEAEDIVRRALETIRHLNTTIMNGNSVDGRLRVASNMVAQDTNDFNRLYEPIMAPTLVDNLALRMLHERVFNGLATGASAWFGDALRRPEEIGDLSNNGRRKMPAMMRGADARALTLTRRMIDTVVKAAVKFMFGDGAVIEKEKITDSSESVLAVNYTAQIHHLAQGNPIYSLPRTAISNCFPGLEFDFRGFWRRALKGITLIENNNYIIEAEGDLAKYIHCRLVAINEVPTMVLTQGPVLPSAGSQSLSTSANPNASSFMEWSNSMASILQKQGEKVTCHFTIAPAQNEVVVTPTDLSDETRFVAIELEVRRLFDGQSSAFSSDLLKPGELTQGLCAPWQNDYRECACYYWAASRPDFVNVVADDNGLAKGDSWMSRVRTGKYIPDNLRDSRLLTYDNLFKEWQNDLQFIVKGRDAIDTTQKS